MTVEHDYKIKDKEIKRNKLECNIIKILNDLYPRDDFRRARDKETN